MFVRPDHVTYLMRVNNINETPLLTDVYFLDGSHITICGDPHDVAIELDFEPSMSSLESYRREGHTLNRRGVRR